MLELRTNLRCIDATKTSLLTSFPSRDSGLHVANGHALGDRRSHHKWPSHSGQQVQHPCKPGQKQNDHDPQWAACHRHQQVLQDHYYDQPHPDSCEHRRGQPGLGLYQQPATSTISDTICINAQGIFELYQNDVSTRSVTDSTKLTVNYTRKTQHQLAIRTTSSCTSGNIGQFSLCDAPIKSQWIKGL